MTFEEKYLTVYNMFVECFFSDYRTGF